MRKRSTAAVSSAESASSGGMRAGFSGTASAHALMSGFDANDIGCPTAQHLHPAQSAGVLEYGDGGHSLFFSSSSSMVAST